MAIIVSHRIRDREFRGGINAGDLEVLRRTARVALATPISAPGLPAGTRLLKAYATSAGGPRRVVYLLVVEAGDLFLLFYRGKSDAIGRNISPSNPTFTRQLIRHLALLEEDISAGRFDSIATP